MIKDIEIDSIASLIYENNKLRISFERNNRFVFSELLYRGQSDLDYMILPSIGRDRFTSSDVTIFNGESNLVDMARNTLPDIFNANIYPIDELALLQHYGIPTRLLDLSENILVVLYFACVDNLK